MTQDERIIDLLQVIHHQGKVTLDFICERYGISSDSARRDLLKLTQKPGILRIRGGALLQQEKTPGLPYVERTGQNSVKARLARYAASLIQPNDVILLDTGTTVAGMAQHIQVAACVITNSIDILAELSHQPTVRKVMLGGEFDPFNRAIYTRESLQQLTAYQADKAFIGVPGLSDMGLSCEKEMEAAFKLAITRQAAYRFFVCEHSKFNQRFLYQSCNWSDVDALITDQMPPENLLKWLEQYEIALHLVEDEGAV